jgi:hypothetical protein
LQHANKIFLDEIEMFLSWLRGADPSNIKEGQWSALLEDLLLFSSNVPFTLAPTTNTRALAALVIGILEMQVSILYAWGFLGAN